VTRDPAGRRRHLRELTARWRARRDAGRRDTEATRPVADAEREERAAASFPYRTMSPADYAATYGADMPGFTYDEYRYDDPDLERWLVELGRELRARRSGQ
jgi:hypothetical protein